MQTHVIISYDGTDNDHDALALGRILGDAGARVSLAYVRHAAESDAAAEQAAQTPGRGAPRARRPVARSPRGRAPRRPQRLDRRGPVGARRARGRGPHRLRLRLAHRPRPRAARQSALRLMDGGPVSIAIAAAGLRDRADAGLRTVAARRRRGRRRRRARRPTARRARRDAARAALAEGLDLLVIGSRPGTPDGRVGLSAASEYVVETADRQRPDRRARRRLRRRAVRRPRGRSDSRAAVSHGAHARRRSTPTGGARGAPPVSLCGRRQRSRAWCRLGLAAAIIARSTPSSSTSRQSR